jgi:hypothetical protein
MGLGGSSGTSGNSGQGGSAGTSGTAGTTGGSGSAGTSGASGTAGSSGTNGTSGTAGASGTNGNSGSSGAAGSPTWTGSEFNNPQAIQQDGLTDLFPNLHDLLTVDGPVQGRLAVQPLQQAESGWYSDSRSPLIAATVAGNFVAETRVRLGTRTSISQTPSGNYSQAGFVVRNANSSVPGNESWVMFNFGFQNGFFGREAKTTRPSPGSSSLSTLFLTPATATTSDVRLRVCRVGSDFRFLHLMPGETAWTEDNWGSGTTVIGNGSGEATPGTTQGNPIRFTRSDLPNSLQVGLMVANWEPPFEARAEFDYLRITPVTNAQECVTALP